MPRLTLAVATAACAALHPLPAIAQQGGTLTLEQVERRFPGMSPIHIEKCDHDDDGLYTQGELACVQSIYNVMYRSRR
jgi:hypothetical protein